MSGPPSGSSARQSASPATGRGGIVGQHSPQLGTPQMGPVPSPMHPGMMHGYGGGAYGPPSFAGAPTGHGYPPHPGHPRPQYPPGFVPGPPGMPPSGHHPSYPPQYPGVHPGRAASVTKRPRLSPDQLQSLVSQSTEHQECVAFLTRTGFDRADNPGRHAIAARIRAGLERKYPLSEVERRWTVLNQCAEFIKLGLSVPAQTAPPSASSAIPTSAETPSQNHTSDPTHDEFGDFDGGPTEEDDQVDFLDDTAVATISEAPMTTTTVTATAETTATMADPMEDILFGDPPASSDPLSTGVPKGQVQSAPVSAVTLIDDAPETASVIQASHNVGTEDTSAVVSAADPILEDSSMKPAPISSDPTGILGDEVSSPTPLSDDWIDGYAKEPDINDMMAAAFDGNLGQMMAPSSGSGSRKKMKDLKSRSSAEMSDPLEMKAHIPAKAIPKELDDLINAEFGEQFDDFEGGQDSENGEFDEFDFEDEATTTVAAPTVNVTQHSQGVEMDVDFEFGDEMDGDDQALDELTFDTIPPTPVVGNGPLSASAAAAAAATIVAAPSAEEWDDFDAAPETEAGGDDDFTFDEVVDDSAKVMKQDGLPPTDSDIAALAASVSAEDLDDLVFGFDEDPSSSKIDESKLSKKERKALKKQRRRKRKEEKKAAKQRRKQSEMNDPRVSTEIAKKSDQSGMILDDWTGFETSVSKSVANTGAAVSPSNNGSPKTDPNLAPIAPQTESSLTREPSAAGSIRLPHALALTSLSRTSVNMDRAVSGGSHSGDADWDGFGFSGEGSKSELSGTFSAAQRGSLKRVPDVPLPLDSPRAAPVMAGNEGSGLEEWTTGVDDDIVFDDDEDNGEMETQSEKQKPDKVTVDPPIEEVFSAASSEQTLPHGDRPPPSPSAGSRSQSGSVSFKASVLGVFDFPKLGIDSPLPETAEQLASFSTLDLKSTVNGQSAANSQGPTTALERDELDDSGSIASASIISAVKNAEKDSTAGPGDSVSVTDRSIRASKRRQSKKARSVDLCSSEINEAIEKEEFVKARLLYEKQRCWITGKVKKSQLKRLMLEVADVDSSDEEDGGSAEDGHNGAQQRDRDGRSGGAKKIWAEIVELKQQCSELKQRTKHITKELKELELRSAMLSSEESLCVRYSEMLAKCESKGMRDEFVSLFPERLSEWVIRECNMDFDNLNTVLPRAIADQRRAQLFVGSIDSKLDGEGDSPLDRDWRVWQEFVDWADREYRSGLAILKKIREEWQSQSKNVSRSKKERLAGYLSGAAQIEEHCGRIVRMIDCFCEERRNGESVRRMRDTLDSIGQMKASMRDICDTLLDWDEQLKDYMDSRQGRIQEADFADTERISQMLVHIRSL